jgi:hypothetical protein
MYNLIIRSNPETNGGVNMKQIIDSIVFEKNNTKFVTFIEFKKEDVQPEIEIQEVINDDILLKDIFEKGFHMKKYDTLIQSFFSSVVNNDDLPINALKFNKYHNPNQCTRLAFDVISMEPFSKLKFKDAYTFIHLDGYCFSIAALGPQIIIQNGHLRHGTVKINLSPFDIDHITYLLHKYREKHQLEFDGYIEATSSKNEYITIKNDSDKFKTFFRDYLEGKVASNINYNCIKTIVFESSNTLIDLIGLTGYILLGDNAIGHESESNRFEIGTSCIGELNHVYHSLPPSLHKSFKELEFDGVKFIDIIQSSQSSCIHGVGYRCLKFYLAAYEAVQFYKTRLHEEVKNMKVLLPWKNEDHQNLVLKLIACFIELPKPFDTSNTYIKYLSCDKMDMTSKSDEETLNCEYLVRGFTNHYSPKFIGYIVFNQFGSYDENEDLIKLALPIKTLQLMEN